MISSRIARKLLCQIGVTAAFLSLVSYRDIAYSAQPVPTVTQAPSTNQADIEDEKPIYPIAEKIIRANGLDDNPWRLKIDNEYDDNASARDVNQIVLLKGLLDKVDGDEAAIAFILGHEIAHHTQKHMYSYTAYAAKLSKQLQAEVDAKVQTIIATETKKFETARSTKRRGKSLCHQDTTKKTSLSAIPEYVALNCEGKLDSNKVEQLKEQITAEKTPEMYKQIAKLSRQQEYEADKFGYMYMVRAGYSPEGALRVLNLMSRLPYHDTDDSSHPSFPDRLNAIKKLMNEYLAPTLVAEGETRLRLNPQPLTYDVSKDGESLRINSRFGSQRQVP
ncbi:peptidase M48 Ste24p [Calothrix sp. NIES-4071]|nr:peptidase M48 Ste24p [Calothrix sp. NIES-4071]BAZ55988.1 peptidase M48 Ste24p [Calothrix sp. NIES-4105]